MEDKDDYRVAAYQNMVKVDTTAPDYGTGQSKKKFPSAVKFPIRLGISIGVLFLVGGYFTAQALATNTSTVNGLRATYFNGRNFTGTSITRTDPLINFSWNNADPGNSISRDLFSARWEGDITAPSGGVYKISTTSDDGVRVWINNELLVNSWSTHSAMDNSGSIYLDGGKKYPIKVEYFQAGGSSIMRLNWSSPSVKLQTIPTSALTSTINMADVPSSAAINEQFSSDSAANNFVPYAGAWSLVNGTYDVKGIASTPLPNGNITLHKKWVSGDFSLLTSVTVKPTGSTWDDVSVIFGYRDPSNYYFVSLNESNDDLTNGIFLVSNGVSRQLLDFPAKRATPGVMQKIGVTRGDKVITVTVDDETIGTAINDTYLDGHVGFGTRNNDASFDNLLVTAANTTDAMPVVTVTPVPTPTPAPTPASVPTKPSTPTPAPTSTPSGTKLSFAPPVLSNPTAITITTANRALKLDDTKDYRLTMGKVSGNVSISGGRNVVLIGGEIDTPGSDRSLMLQFQRGMIHVEGVYIKGAGLKEGINIDQRYGGGVTLQNIKIDPITGTKSGHHADIVQTWSGPKIFRIDRLEGTSDYQCMMIGTTQFGNLTGGFEFDFRNIVTRGSCAYYVVSNHGITGKSLNVVNVGSGNQVTRGAIDVKNVTSAPSPLTGNPGAEYRSPGYN